MSVQLSKIKQFLFYAAIILTNVIVMHDYIVIPIVNSLYELFPDSVAGVNFIVSGPAIIMFVSSLLVPFMLKVLNKKTLLSVVCIIFTISAIGGAAIVSLPYMIFTRSVCGFCYGIVQVVALDIVADYFVDGNKLASFMGIYNAGAAAIGAVMGLIAGNLAVTGWKNAYATYFLAIPMTLLVLFFVPKMDGQGGEMTDAEAENGSAEKAPMGAKFWIALITFMIFGVCNTPLLLMPAVYIAENSLGTESLAGLAASINTVGSAVFCLAFGFLYSKLKARTSVISYILLALGLLGMYFIPNRFLLIGICLCSGGALGMMISYMYAHIPSIIPPQNVSKAMSYITAGSGFVNFIGIYVVTAIMNLMGTAMVTPVLLVLGIVMAICAAVNFISTAKM